MIWAPPTPPQDENDLYIDYSLGFLYEKTLMPESQLPPIYIPKEHKRLRVDVPLPHGRKHLQSNHPTNAQVHPPSHVGPLNTKTSRRTDDLYTIPKSPFDRSTSLIIRFRRELLIMKTKLWPGSSNLISSIQRTFAQMGSSVIPPSNIASMQSLAKTNFNTKLYPRWLIHEEFSIIMVLIYLQDLPYNLSIICPGHIPNWDLVAEQVNTYNSFKRSMKFCKFHFESVLAAKNDPNHMNDNDTPKTPLQNHLLNAKQSKSNKKAKNQSQSVLNQTSSFMSPNSQSITLNPSMPMTGLGTSVIGKGLLNSSLVSTNALPSPAQPLYRMSNILQNMVSDNNTEFTDEMNKRFDAIKQIVISKTQTSKSRFIKKHQPKTFDHVSLLLSEYDIKYDKPLSVVELATIRAERISKDKQAVREQQAREAREINQIKAFIQGNTSTPPTFHTSNSMSSPSVMNNIGVAANSSTHLLQQQQSTPQILMNQVNTVSNIGGHIQQQSQSQQSPQVLINQVSASPGQATTFISAPQLQHVLAQSKKMQSGQSSASIIGASQRILTSSASPGQLIASTVPASIIATNKGGNQPIITRTIRADLASQLHGNVTVVPSSMVSSSTHTTAVPDPGNQLRQIQLLQKRPTPQIQVSSTGSHHQVLMHKAIVQQSGGNHSITVSSDGQQSHSVNSASTNIISPMLQSSNSGTISKNTFQLVPASIMQQQQQSNPITVTKTSREQQAREAREINQIKAFIQGNTSTPPTFHTSNSISSPSVMGNIGVATNSSTHLQQQQQSSPQILMSNIGSHIQQQSQSQQSPQVLINQVSASPGQATTFISAPQLQHVLAQSKKMQSGQSSASIIGSSQRILTSSASPGQLIASTVPGSIIATNKGGNQPIIARTIRADLASQLHGNVTVVSSSISPPSSSSSTVTAVPIPGNHLRQIQLLQKRPTPQIQVSSTCSHQQVLMHKAIVQQSGGAHSITVSSDGQQSHSVNSASTNIISPMLQSSNSGTISKNTFQLVPASIVQQQQQQSTPITVTKTVLTSSPTMAQQVQQVQQALKQGQIIMQQQAQNSGQVAQTANSPQVKTSAGQHFIAVSSNDSQSSIPVNATTIKLLPTSATLAIQQHQGQQSTSATTSLPQSIATPKGHIIISGHATAAGASSHISSSALLQQVVSNQSSSNSGQTLTFAIRTAHGQQLPVQPQPGTLHLSALTLKTPTSAPHGNPLTTSLTTSGGTTTTQQPSALVAALSQSTPPASSESFANAATPTSANSNLMRTLASNLPSKAIPIPIVLMQSSQNASLINQSTPSLLNTVSSSSVSRSPMNAAGNKITTSTQTAGNSALGSILNSAVKVPPSETQFVHMPGTPSVSSKPPESPLIEALMSPIGKLPRSSMMSTPQPKPDESRSEADN